MTTIYDDELNHHDITLVTNATLRLPILWRTELGFPVDLTDYAARMQARDSSDAPTPWFDVSEADHISLGGTSGTIVVEIPPSITSLVTSEHGVYDLLLTSPDGVVTRLLWGCVCVQRGVTRD